MVELLAVIVILGIIAAIAIPAIGNIITNSKVSALKADGQNAIAAANIYFAEATGTDTTVTTKELATEGYLDDVGGFESEATITKGSGDVTTITISGTAVNGNVNVVFEGASNADINAADNKTGGTNVTVNR